MEKQRVNVGITKVSKQTEFTPKDIANMCGLAAQYQAKAIYDLQNYDQIRIEDGKIFIKDVGELMKQAAFYRKQNNTKK